MDFSTVHFQSRNGGNQKFEEKLECAVLESGCNFKNQKFKIPAIRYSVETYSSFKGLMLCILCALFFHSYQYMFVKPLLNLQFVK